MNEPLPNQLTVGKLRRLLENAQENAVVILKLPAGYQAHPQLNLLINLDVRVGGPVVVFSPQTQEQVEPAV